jgi:23S rRNA (guanosine2251-2'-O)-methyltransferase
MQDQHDIVYGIHPVVELIKAKRRKIAVIYTTRPEPKAWSLIAKILPSYVKIHYGSSQKLTQIAQTADHQGVVAYVMPYPYRRKSFNPSTEKFILLLDRIQDPRNLGAILRSAYATGVDGVMLTQKASAPLSPVALKAAAGLAEHLQIMLVPSGIAGAKMLAEDGYSIYPAAIGPKSKKLHDVTFKEPLCIVIGSEGTGVSRELLSVGTCIQLPQRTADISYNASVAAGILLFWVATQCKKLI